MSEGLGGRGKERMREGGTGGGVAGEGKGRGTREKGGKLTERKRMAEEGGGGGVRGKG